MVRIDGRSNQEWEQVLEAHGFSGYFTDFPDTSYVVAVSLFDDNFEFLLKNSLFRDNLKPMIEQIAKQYSFECIWK